MPTNEQATQKTPADEIGPDAHLYVTLDEADETQVLELVRVEGDSYFIRESGGWMQADPEDDDSPVWGQILDVTPDVIDAYDAAHDSGDVGVDDIQAHVIPDEGASQ